MNKSDFWDNKRESEKIISELNLLRKSIEDVNSLKTTVSNNLEMALMLKNTLDLELKNLLEEEIPNIEISLDELEMTMLLGGHYDKMGAIVEIRSGAGGTEACDWAEMLYRMYSRWVNKEGYKLSVLDYLDGDGAGYKSITFLVEGMNTGGRINSVIFLYATFFNMSL